MKTQKQHLKYWRDMHMDWKKSCTMENVNHPHRVFLIEILKKFNFGSILEIGCGSGANLYRIQKEFPKVSIGGIDVNKDAIESALEFLPTAEILEVGNAQKLFLSDNSVDLVLTDAVLLYLNNKGLKKTLKEIKRVARKGIVLCELHSTNPWHRLRLRLLDKHSILFAIRHFWDIGYNVHDYIKLLDKHGFRSIQVYKIPQNSWKGFPWEYFGYVITAKI